MDPTPTGTTQPTNRGRALILGVLHAMAVPTEPKSGMGIVATIRRTTVVTADIVGEGQTEETHSGKGETRIGGGSFDVFLDCGPWRVIDSRR